MIKWVDPASGWRYGFPALWDDEEETIKELLDRHNYPEDLRQLPMRMWEGKDES